MQPHLAQAPSVFEQAKSADLAGIVEVVSTLERGFNSHDADVTDSVMAQDIVWGSPKGEVVTGLGTLNAIHHRLKTQHVGGVKSRYEIKEVAFLDKDTACAHVSRIGTDEHGAPLERTSKRTIAQEMALYILVKRGDRWWIAAGQNTPIL